jgi:hypothetical protein
MLDTVNHELGQHGTVLEITGNDPRKVLADFASSEVICGACQWTGLGGAAELEDTSSEDNTEPTSPNFAKVSANLNCPKCQNTIAVFNAEFVPKSEIASVEAAEQIVAEFDDVVNGGR